MPTDVPFLCRPNTQLAEQLLREKPGVVLDLGSFEGGYFPNWLEYGATKVIGFEPVPWNYEKMFQRWDADRRIEMHCLAVGEKPAEVHGALIYNAHTLAAAGTVKLDEAAENPGRKFNFRVVAIDDWMEQKENKGLHIAFVKLDVDGYEPAALRGMRVLLAKDRPPIMIELSGLPKAFGEDCAEMVHWIYARGYKICTMEGDVCESPMTVLQHYPWHTSFDVMAVPNHRIGAKWPRV